MLVLHEIGDRRIGAGDRGRLYIQFRGTGQRQGISAFLQQCLKVEESGGINCQKRTAHENRQHDGHINENGSPSLRGKTGDQPENCTAKFVNLLHLAHSIRV